METKRINGVLYKLVPRVKEKSCESCAFKDPNGDFCTILTNVCNKDLIYKKVDEPISTLEDLVSQYMEANIGYREFEEGIEKWYRKYGKNTEKKLNFKAFNFEAAKSGNPVCTRDGRKARIVCFDKTDERPIVALISDNGSEFIYEYLINGKCYKNKDDSNDLMMLPEKKEGWINIYKGGLLDTKSYSSKEEAVCKANQADYIDTIKIKWEE